jgi:hypothetical protein
MTIPPICIISISIQICMRNDICNQTNNLHVLYGSVIVSSVTKFSKIHSHIVDDTPPYIDIKKYLHLFMYISIYIYIYTYIHVFICTYVYIYICIYICT